MRPDSVVRLKLHSSHASNSQYMSIFSLHYCAYFSFAATNLQHTKASVALRTVAIWTAVIQFVMIIVGTFIIKRFSTSFSVGFLLGIVIVVSQQYLLLAVTFWNNNYGSWAQNVAFANLAFGLFVLYSIFAMILGFFRESIMVAAVDAKGFGKRFSRKQPQGTMNADGGLSEF